MVFDLSNWKELPLTDMWTPFLVRAGFWEEDKCQFCFECVIFEMASREDVE